MRNLFVPVGAAVGLSVPMYIAYKYGEYCVLEEKFSCEEAKMVVKNHKFELLKAFFFIGSYEDVKRMNQNRVGGSENK